MTCAMIFLNNNKEECFSTLRKQLAEGLVLPKIDYGNVIMNNLPMYMIQRLQKIQNVTSGFMIGKHAIIDDVISLS